MVLFDKIVCSYNFKHKLLCKTNNIVQLFVLLCLRSVNCLTEKLQKWFCLQVYVRNHILKLKNENHSWFLLIICKQWENKVCKQGNFVQSILSYSTIFGSSFLGPLFLTHAVVCVCIIRCQKHLHTNQLT